MSVRDHRPLAPGRAIRVRWCPGPTRQRKTETMSTKKQLRRQRQERRKERRQERAKARSPMILLVFLLALLLIGAAAYFFGQRAPSEPGQVWSEEHQHWH